MVLSVLLQYSVHMIKPLAEEQPTEHRSFWETQKELLWLLAKSASYSSSCVTRLMQTGAKWGKMLFVTAPLLTTCRCTLKINKCLDFNAFCTFKTKCCIQICCHTTSKDTGVERSLHLSLKHLIKHTAGRAKNILSPKKGWIYFAI